MKTLYDLRFIEGILNKDEKVLAVSVDLFKNSMKKEIQEKIDLLKKKMIWTVKGNVFNMKLRVDMKLDENDLQLLHEVSYCLRKFNFDLDEFDWS